MAGDVDGPAHSGETAPIDLGFLATQTCGDTGLARELLSLFGTHAAGIAERLRNGLETPASHRDLVHTLKGSAKAIGARHVVAAAENCEASPREPDALARLVAAAAEAIAAADRLLAARDEIG